MNNPNFTPANKNQSRKLIRAARVAAVGLAATIAPISTANASQSHEKAKAPHYNTVNEAIAVQDKQISRDIAEQLPVKFINEMAYYHGPGKDHFYIENPLSVNVSVGPKNEQVDLIGYIERKGSGAGPDVVMFDGSRGDTTTYADNADQASIREVSTVIFPSVGGAAYDLNNPTNSATETAYLDQAGNPSLVAYQYVAKK